MNRRAVFFAIVFVLLAWGVWRLWPARENRGVPPTGTSAVLRTAARPVQAAPASAGEIPGAKTFPAEDRIALADALNAPEGNIQGDLRVLNDVFQAWLTNFPHDGNPVGENAEITAALAGDNSLRLALIPRDHRAINARGEICDRWGTPFRFHQLSGSRMEIRSAGPDRKFGTADDATFSP